MHWKVEGGGLELLGSRCSGAAGAGMCMVHWKVEKGWAGAPGDLGVYVGWCSGAAGTGGWGVEGIPIIVQHHPTAPTPGPPQLPSAPCPCCTTAPMSQELQPGKKFFYWCPLCPPSWDSLCLSFPLLPTT